LKNCSTETIFSQ